MVTVFMLKNIKCVTHFPPRFFYIFLIILNQTNKQNIKKKNKNILANEKL